MHRPALLTFLRSLALGAFGGVLTLTPVCFASYNSKITRSNDLEAPPPKVQSEILGIAVEIPANATGEHLSQGEHSRIRIRETSTPPEWVVTIRQLRAPTTQDGRLTPTSFATLFIEDARRISPDLLVIAEEPAQVLGRPAARIAVEIPHGETGKRARYDWVFIQTTPDRFALVEQVSHTGPAGDAAQALREILASLVITNPAETETLWRDRAQAGAEVVRRIDERVLRHVLEDHGTEVWYRRHAFDADGKTLELGYAGVSAIETTKDQLGKAKPAPTTDGETGLLVRIRTHKFPSEEGKPSWDVDAQAWMSWDREEEFFSTVATARTTTDGEAFSISHVGIRPRPSVGKPQRTLQVFQERADKYTRDQLLLDIPDLGIYLSETERLLLPYLLPMVGAPSGEFTLYAWHPERQEITRRLDAWTLEDNGGWKLHTRSYPDAPVSTAVIDAKGNVSSRVIVSPSGSERWTLVTPDGLSKHYRRTGIQVNP
jgi:hypothetical protein